MRSSSRWAKTSNWCTRIAGPIAGPLVTTDIDGDQKDEALVFYTDNKGDNVRINLMNQQDGKWQVLYDMSGESANIDFVDFANL